MKLLLLACAKPLAGFLGVAGFANLRSVDIPEPAALRGEPAPREFVVPAERAARPRAGVRVGPAGPRVEIVPAPDKLPAPEGPRIEEVEAEEK